MGSFFYVPFVCCEAVVWFFCIVYVGLIQGHPINKQHCLLLSGKTFPKLNTVVVCLSWSIHAAPLDIYCFFLQRLLCKGFFQKLSVHGLSYSINIKQYSVFPGTRTCVLQRAFAQVFDFQCEFSSQSKIPQINWRIWRLIFVLTGLQYCSQPHTELGGATVKGGGVESHGLGLLLQGSQALAPVCAKHLSSSRCVLMWIYPQVQHFCLSCKSVRKAQMSTGSLLIVNSWAKNRALNEEGVFCL